MVDYYKILEINRNVTSAEIKKAYVVFEFDLF